MTKDIFSKLPDFKNEDELKNFLRVEKNIDYYSGIIIFTSQCSRVSQL